MSAERKGAHSQNEAFRFLRFTVGVYPREVAEAAEEIAGRLGLVAGRFRVLPVAIDYIPPLSIWGVGLSVSEDVLDSWSEEEIRFGLAVTFASSRYRSWLRSPLFWAILLYSAALLASHFWPNTATRVLAALAFVSVAVAVFLADVVSQRRLRASFLAAFAVVPSVEGVLGYVARMKAFWSRQSGGEQKGAALDDAVAALRRAGCLGAE